MALLHLENQPPQVYDENDYDSSLESKPLFSAVAGNEGAVKGGSGMASGFGHGNLSPFRFDSRAFLITAAAFGSIMIIGVAAFLLNNLGNKNSNTPTDKASKYGVTKLTINEADQANATAQLKQADKLAINGQLQVGNTLVLAPTSAPSTATAGQIYYDKNTNTPYYYNGTQFVSIAPAAIPASVSSLGGATGAVSVGSGLQVTSNSLNLSDTFLSSLSTPKVTTLQGQSGALSLAAGAGISISGLNVTNTGVTNLTGTTDQINVSGSTGNVQLSLPQAIATSSSPVFSALTLGSALDVDSGGTGNTSAGYSTNAVLFYDGTKFISTGTPAANDCLVADSLGVPQFTSCGSGGGSTVSQIQGHFGDVAATGNITFNNATTALHSVTIDDASTSAKGIASFSNTYFNVGAGDVSIKDDSLALGTKTTGNYVQSITTGNGLSGGVSSESAAASLNLVLQANMGLQNTSGGLGLISCSITQVLKYDGANWACATDATGTGGVSLVNTFNGDITIQGTTKQVTVTNGSNIITLSLPQDIDTAATPTFAGINLTGASQLKLGTSSQRGALYLYDGSTINKTTLQSAASLGADLTFTLPNAVGTNGQCIKANGGAGVLMFGDCLSGASGSGVTTLNTKSGAVEISSSDSSVTVDNSGSQIIDLKVAGIGSCASCAHTLSDAYTNSSGSTALIPLNSTRGGVQIQDNSAALGGTLFSVTNNGGGTKYLDVSSAGVGITGALAVSTSVSTGGTLRLDASGNLGSIGTITSTGIATLGNNTLYVLPTGNLVGVGASPNASGAKLQVQGGIQSAGSVVGDNANLAGTLVYDSAAGKFKIYEGPTGAIKTLCNSVDGCATTGGAVTLATAYTNFSASPAAIQLTSGLGGVIIQDALAPTGGDLFTVQSNAGAKFLNVTATGALIAGAVRLSGLDCTASGIANGGKITTDALGNLSCASDIGAGVAGADTLLHNLTAQTTVNQNLAPDATANNRDIGATGFKWHDLYLSNDIIQGGNLAVNGSAITSTNTGIFNLLATNVTTLNIGDATTTLNLAGGSTASGCTINATGDLACAGTITGGSAGTNLAAAYTNFGSAAANIPLANSGSRNGIAILDNLTPLGTDLFTVANSGGGTKYLNVTASGISTTGLTTSGKGAFGAAINVNGATLQSAGGVQLAAITAPVADSNSDGTIFYDTADHKFKIVETGVSTPTIKTLCNSVDGCATSGGATTLATAYTNFSTGPAAILLSGSLGGVIIKDASTSIAADLFTVANNGGGTKYLNVTTSGVSTTGLLSSNSNTTGMALTGTPVAGTGITSLLQLGSPIAGGNSAANGGTYIGLNAPSTLAGSAADFINLQYNGVSKLKVTNTGAVDATGSVAYKKGTDFITVGQSDNVNFSDVSLVRLTGASAQTITGIANGRDGRILTIVNAGTTTATISDKTSGAAASSSAINRIVTGTNADISLVAGSSISLIYDSVDSYWRVVGDAADAGCTTCAKTDFTNLLGTVGNLTTPTTISGITGTVGNPAGASFTIQGGNAYSVSGNNNGGTLTIDSGAKNGTGTSTLNLGTTNATAVVLGNNSTATITLGSSSAAQSVLIGNGTGAAATVSIANATANGATVNIAGGATANTFTDTVNIATGNSAAGGNGAKVVHIADGTPAGTGINTVTIGSTGNASKVNLQGGTAVGASGGSVSIAAGSQFINGSSTVNTSSPLGNLASGSLGTNTTTVDIFTAFTINPAASGRTYTIPSPSNTNAGRIIYVQNISGSFSITVGGTVIPAGAAQSYVWNGAAWTTTNAAGSAVDLQGAYNNTGATAANDGSGNVALIQTTANKGVAIQASSGNDVVNLLDVMNASNGSLLKVDSTYGGNITLNNANPGTLPAWTASAQTFDAGNGSHYGTGTVAYNGYLYEVGGGFTQAAYAPIKSSGDVGAFTTTNAPANVSTGNTMITAANGYLFAIVYTGTSTVNDFAYSSKINADGSLSPWKSINPTATNHNSGGMVYYKGYLYVMGGYTGFWSNIVESAQVNADGTVGPWKAQNTMPYGTISMYPVIANGTLYILSGNIDNGGAAVRSYIQAAPILANGGLGTWVSTTSSSIPDRQMYAAIAKNGYLYLIGGQNNGGTTSTVVYSSPIPATVSSGTLAATVWTAQSSVAGYGRVNGAGVTESGKTIYVLGGEFSNGLSYVNTTSTQISGSLDLVSGTGIGQSTGNTGGELTAGSTQIFGTLQVQDQANFAGAISVGGTLSVAGSASIGSNSAQIQPYQTSPNALCTTYSSTQSVVVNGYAYTVGGWNGAAVSSVCYAKINTDGSLGTWSATKPLPGGRSGLAIATANGYLYELGGWGGSVQSIVYSAKVNSDGTVGDWTTNTPLPGVSQQHSTFVSNGYIYVINGYDGSSLKTTIYYAKLFPDGTIGAWKSSSNILPGSVGRMDAGVTVANGYAYVVGGWNGGANQTTVFYSKLNSDGTFGTWSTNPNPLPTPVSNNSVFALNGYLYSIGGGTTAVNYARLNSDGSTGLWTGTTNTIPLTTGLPSVTANGYIITLGGASGATAYYTSTERLQVGGSLDLVGASGGTMTDGGSGGGYLTAGNTNIIGSLQVGNQANFAGSVSVGGALNVAGQANLGQGLAMTGSINGVNYTTGTITQTGSASIAGAGTTFTTGMVGGTLYYPDGTACPVATYLSTTSITVGGGTNCTAKSVTGSNYVLQWGGLSVNSSGTSSLQSTSNSTTAFQIQDSAAANTLLTVNTNNNIIKIGDNVGTNGGAGTSSGTVFVLDSILGGAANASAPTCDSTRAGGMYYNTTNYTVSICGGASTPAWSALGSTSLQGAYTAGNTVTTSDARDISFTLANTATDSNFLVNVAPSSTSKFAVQKNNVDTFSISATGQLLSKNSADSTTAFDVQNAGGDSMLTIDTTKAGAISINNANNGATGGATSNWNTMTSIPYSPGPGRRGAQSVTANGYLYVLGGYLSNNGYYGDVFFSKIKADGTLPSSGQNGYWTATTSMPQGIGKSSAVFANGYIFLIGGNDGGGTQHSDIYAAKVNSNGTLGAWRQTTALGQTIPGITSGGTPIGELEAAAYSNGYIYVAGGRKAGAVDNGNIYWAKVGSDGRLGGWLSSAVSVAHGAGTSVVATNGYIYMLGGNTDTTSYSKLGTDGTPGSWTNVLTGSLGGMPSGYYKYAGAAVAVNGYIYMMGGCTCGPATTSMIYAKVNPANGSIVSNANAILGSGWVLGAAMPGARYWAPATTYNGYIYSATGSNDDNQNDQNDVYMTSTSRISASGTLDLVGNSGSNFVDDNSAGGGLIAGNTQVVGSFQVQGQSSFLGQASFASGLGVGDGTLSVSTANNGLVSVGFTGGFTMSAEAGYITTTGGGPFNNASGDLNGDGYADIVVAEQNTNHASVYLNKGDGTFAAKVDYSTGAATNPESITLTDYSGDGVLDIVTSNYGSDNVSLLTNNGSGAFTLYGTKPAVGGAPTAAVGADFDGDGKNDLAVANRSGAQKAISILLSTRSGVTYSFASKADYGSTGTQPYGIATADFNGDGLPDVVTANTANDTVSVFLNLGGGIFSNSPATYTTGSGPWGVTAVDLNGDGRADIAANNRVSGTVSVFLNNGRGGFPATGTQYTSGSTPTGVTYGDFNGDGYPDLASANYYGNNLSVLLNAGNGTFPTQTSYAGDWNAWGVSAADYNNDNRIDVALGFANYTTYGLGVYLNATPGAGLAVSGKITGAQSLTIAGNITAGNEKLNGSLQVGGQASFGQGIAINGSINGQNYTTGTIQQTTSTVTGTGTTFTAGMVGGTLFYPDGSSCTVTAFASTTSITVSCSKTVAALTTFVLQWGGLGVNSSGTSFLQSTSNSTSAFQIQNSTGTSLFTADTTGAGNLSVLSNSATIPGWTPSSNALNFDRTGSSGVAANGYLYVIGGTCSGGGNCGGSSRDVYYAKIKSNGSPDTWNALSLSLPEARWHGTAVTANGYIYYIGGYNGAAEQKDYYYAKIKSDGTLGAWTLGTTTMAFNRVYTSSSTANGYVYVVGGDTTVAGTNPQSTVYYAKMNADGSLGAWTAVTGAAFGTRNFNTAFIANGYLYASAGYSAGVVYTTYAAPLNASTGAPGTFVNTGTTIPSTGTSHTQAVVVNNNVYLIGGKDGSAYFTTGYTAKITSGGGLGAWTSSGVATLPLARGDGVLLTQNGYIYQIGGTDGYTNGFSTNYYASTTRTSVGGTLDLVSGNSQDYTNAGTGSSLVAGNTTIVGTLYVQDSANFLKGLGASGNSNFGGDLSVTSTSNSTSAFQVQNATAKQIFNVDTINGNALLGHAGSGGVNGALVFNNSTNSNTITLVSGATSSSYSLTMPTAGPAVSQCLQTDVTTASLLKFGSCSAGSDLQGAYTASSSPALITSTNAKDFRFSSIDSATDASFVVNSECGSAACSAGGGRFAVQYASTDMFTLNPGASSSGHSLVVKNSTDGQQAYQFNNVGGTVIMNIDTSGFKVGIGSNNTAPNATLDVKGNVLIKDTVTDRSNQFEIQDSGSNSVFKVDTANRLIGINDTTTSATLNITNTAGHNPLSLNEVDCDCTLVDFKRSGTSQGSISISSGTVSYNAFTGSHYALSDETIDNGLLVKVSGLRGTLHNDPQSEVLYDVSPTTTRNDPTALGSFQKALNDNKPASADNPYLVSAAGNGQMWVVDDGSSLSTGDYLISSNVPGHAVLDTRIDNQSYIVAKVAEPVDWSTVTETINGHKHKKISVFYTMFVRDNTNANIQSLVNGVTNSIGNGTATLQAQTASVGDLNVSGIATVGSLHVTGDATIEGTLTVGAVVATTLTVNGHIITGGDAPTTATTLPSSTATVEGTDTAGSITITVGADTAAGGNVADVTFNSSYAKAPKVSLTPDNDQAAAMQYFTADRTKDGFSIHSLHGIPAGTYKLTFQVIQ